MSAPANTPWTVIGKAQRLGLGTHANKGHRFGRAPQGKPAQRRKVPKTVLATLEAVFAAPDPPVARQPGIPPVTIEELRFPIRQCRWIDDDSTADALYCGAKVKRGTSWCPEHHARVWRSRNREAAA